jgi:bifunctional non-homologous end joining protein LigD
MASVTVLGEPLSHPERVLYPAIGKTKLDVARYFEAVAAAMLPHVLGRPLTVVRCPVGLAGECHYMKHHLVGTKSRTLAQIPIPEKKKVGSYLVVENAAGLIALCQLGVLEVHTWNSTRDALERPDRLVLDLDPGPDVPWRQVIEAARLVRARLASLGLTSFVKTTGGVGLHVVVPLAPEIGWDACLDLSRALAGLIAAERPRHYTTAMPKAGREAKILIDYLRNNRGNTSVAAFSTRAKPEATVSVPIAWDELDPRLRPARFTITTVPRRLARLGADPWADYFRRPQRLPKELSGLLADRARGDVPPAGEAGAQRATGAEKRASAAPSK